MARDESGLLRGRVAVLSPHLDDAALALGATIARTAAGGGHVTVVTPFAGDPASEAPAGWWDRARGFGTEGEAARCRREEDRRACAILGAVPVWLGFRDEQYGQSPDAASVWEALEAHLQGDAVLLPGFPLRHPDHAWVTELVLDRLPPGRRAGLYLELPYARPRDLARRPAALQRRLGHALSWNRLRPRREDLRAKGRACRAYRSQFGLLRPHVSPRLAFPELWPTPECLAWIDEDERR